MTDAPAGVSIDPATKRLSWQVPDQYDDLTALVVTVEVFDPFAPLIRESMSFTVLVNPHPWQNPFQAVDVDGNGIVESLDVLLTINLTNVQGVGYRHVGT